MNANANLQPKPSPATPTLREAEAKRKFWTDFGLAMVIFVWLLGMVIGAFNSRNVELGTLVGGIFAFSISVPAFYFCSRLSLNRQRKLLQQNSERDAAWGAIPDLSYRENLPPMVSFVHLLLYTAIKDGMETISFSLENENSADGLRIAGTAKGVARQLPPAGGSLFGPAVVVMCNYASVAYYAKGPVTGELRTTRPDSCWRLQSDDLKKELRLSKIS